MKKASRSILWNSQQKYSMKKGVLEKFAKFKIQFVLRNFKKHLFYRTLLDDCFCFYIFRSSHRRCSMKKGVLENFPEIHRKTPLVSEIFKNTFFYRTTLDDCFWIFRATLRKWGNANKNGVFGKPQMNIRYLETLTLEVPFRYISSFFGRINFQCIFSLVYTVYCEKQLLE